MRKSPSSTKSICSPRTGSRSGRKLSKKLCRISLTTTMTAPSFTTGSSSSNGSFPFTIDTRRFKTIMCSSRKNQRKSAPPESTGTMRAMLFGRRLRLAEILKRTEFSSLFASTPESVLIKFKS